MTDKEDAGASYLAALRQSRTPQAAAAALARVPDTPRSQNPPIGSTAPHANVSNPTQNKRRSPRYQCNGSVRLHKKGSDTSTWATFSDISIHGCYIESAVPYPQGAMAELKLDANGFRIDATGEVRVSYPGLGMGIAFVKMSEADRSRLHDLISSIAPHSVVMGAQLPTQSVLMARSDAPVAVKNPSAVLQVIVKFFEDRHMMGREEFLRILRDSE